MKKQLVYVADPMCSWCWGFSPVIQSVIERFGGQLPVQLLMGGLRPGTTDAMDDAGRKMIRDHWGHVHEASGQPFDFAFFEREGFVYDTEPPSRAVVAARREGLDAAFAILKKIQHAFYAENKDVTDDNVLMVLAGECGLDKAVFGKFYYSEEGRSETRDDFAAARRAGISGFPALVAGSDSDGYEVVTMGYRPWEKLEGLITSWLDRQS